MPKISVIMGVYNSQSEYMLSRAIDSILDQDYTDFEFIICNDCSTKGFIIELLSKYQSKDERIVIIKNEGNMGLAASLNNCLNIAKGEYIARQDDDDISLPNRFSTQVDYLDNHPDVPLVSCNLLLLDDKGIWGKHVLKERPMMSDLLYGTIYAHPALMARKNTYDIVGNYTVEEITKRTEDYDLYFRMAYNGIYGVNLQEYLFIYYQGVETYRKQKLKHKIDEFKLKRRWFEKLNLYPRGYYLLIKPILSGLCPSYIRINQKRKKFSMNSDEVRFYNDKFNKLI
jgi:glycosyltransferase EpsE